MIFKHSFSLHPDLKSGLLHSIKYSPGKEFKDSNDSIAKTDYYEKLSIDQKQYLGLLHSNLNSVYEDMMQHYCISDFSLYNGWYQQYNKSDTHGWHIHAMSTLSMVYYIELEDPTDCTEFWIPETRTRFQPDVVEGDIIVFPASIPHRSPPLQSSSRKTIISCNYNIQKINSNCINHGK